MSRSWRSCALKLALLLVAGVLAPSCGGRGAIAPGGVAGSPGTGGGAAAGASGSGGGADGGAAPAGSSGAAGAGGAPSTRGADGGYGGYGDGGFVPDFTARAGASLAAGAPSWVCATPLPNVPVADAAAAREAVRQFIAQVVGVPPADIAVTVPRCGPGTATCAATFSHDVSKSGGNIYNAVAALADELDATATAVEETIWVPMQNGTNFAADVVLGGISDGMLVGMAVFNYPSTCP